MLVSQRAPVWLAAALLALQICAINITHAQAQEAQPSHQSLRQLPTIALNAQAQQLDILPYTEYWIDDSPDTTASALVARASAGVNLFQPNSSALKHDVHGKVLWLRFEISLTDPRSRWLLQLGSPLIDDVQLHWRDAQGTWQMLKAGDVVPRSQWPIQTRLPTFTLEGPNNESAQYYLRIKNARFPVSLPMVIYRDTAYMSNHQAQTMLLGALIGLVLLMLVVSTAMAVQRREQAFAAYAFYLLALGLFTLTNTGLSPLYLWNESPLLADRMNYVLAGLTAAIGPWLVRMIITPTHHNTTLDRLVAMVFLALFTLSAIELWIPSLMSYRLLNVGTLTSVALVYALIAAAWQRGEAVTRWMAIGFAPIALSALPLILRNMGLISNSWLTQYAVPLASTIEMPILLYALFLRSSQRREAIARAAGLPTRDAFTGLPNTRVFLEHLHGSLTRAQSFRHHYGLMLVELSNHAWFVKEHGREMADRALIIASTRLQQIARDVDCVCRLDNSRFAMLIEGHCSASLLTRIAARINASGLQPTQLLPVGATLKLVITCALMPNAQCEEAGDDANAKLGWLIQAAEALPLEVRKTVRTIGF